MDAECEGLNEQELKKLLDKAEDYETRAKIRAAIRNLKKTSGAGRRTTGTSVYRRPGFQAPKTVQIPNSVTGNVLPSSLKDGESIKPPDKNTPTIGYLNATTTVKATGKKGSDGSPRASQSTYISQPDPTKEQESWWSKSKSQSSSRSQTPSDTSEQKINKSESDQVFSELMPEPPREPTPEPPREPTPEPPREPTPEPPREPTPEPPREPTPEPPREPTPEPPREPTPEPLREPTPEPPREPTPEPIREPSPSPEPVEEQIPSPEPVNELESQLENDDLENENNQEENEQFSDEEDDELQALEEERSFEQQQSASQMQLVNNSLPIDVLQEVEPGLEENKDFRTKLRKTEDATIDTKAAFPSQKAKAEQVDFRNVLKKATGPEKKTFKVEQVDFRGKLKPKDSQQLLTDDNDELQVETSAVQEEEETLEEETKKDINDDDEQFDKPEEKSVQNILEEDSYEARKEARRREREKKNKEETEKKNTESTENGYEEDSYEARREARRLAREAKRKEQEEKPMTYKEKQQIEQAKRMEENKKKWSTLDQSSANETSEKPVVTRQKSSGQRGAQQLLVWCQHKTRYYENVEVKDFSNSFANGLALCAILHTFVPDDIPYDDLSPDNPTENFGVALKVSEDVGIGSFFDVEDLVSVKAPDPKSMMTFLATIYQHFK